MNETMKEEYYYWCIKFKYLMITSSFPLHAVVIQQLYNQIKKQNQIIIHTLIELYASRQQACIPYIPSAIHTHTNTLRES